MSSVQGLVTSSSSSAAESCGKLCLTHTPTRDLVVSQSHSSIHPSTGPFQWELLHYQMGNEEIPVKRRAPPVSVPVPYHITQGTTSVTPFFLCCRQAGRRAGRIGSWILSGTQNIHRGSDCANNCHPSKHINYTSIHSIHSSELLLRWRSSSGDVAKERMNGVGADGRETLHWSLLN